MLAFRKRKIERDRALKKRKRERRKRGETG